jgi:IclR family KDG regulon transcriptional repressor
MTDSFPQSDGENHLAFSPVKSADRALALIELLTKNREGLTFTELQELTELPRSSLYGLLRTMAERQHLQFDPHSQGYRIGLRLWEAGQAFNAGVEIEEVAMPHMRLACDQLDETIQLAVLDGIENIYVAKVDASHALRLDSFVGARLPAYATGIGKVLLSGLTKSEVDQLLEKTELIQFTDTTVSDAASLHSALEQIRKQGFAVDDAEYTLGVYCFAVPVFDVSGKIVAAMSASIPEPRLSEGIEKRALEILQEAATQISTQLGYRVD